MPLLIRYIVAEHLKFIGLLLATFLMIFFTIHALEKMRWLSHAPFFWIAQHFLLRIPKMIADLMPLSLLLATLLTLGTLSRHNEVIPMMNAGMPMVRLAAPLLAVGGIISVLFIFLNGSFVPYTLRLARVMQQEKIEKKGEWGTFLQNKIWFRLDAKTLLYTQMVDPQENTLHGVHLYYLGNELPLQQEIEAKTLRYQEGAWTLFDGVRMEYQQGGGLTRIPFRQEPIQIQQTFAEMQQVAVRPEEMTHKRLSSYIRQLEENGLNAQPYQAALHYQRAFPLANVILVLLGIPLSFSYLRRGGIMKSVVFGLGIVLLYWLLLSVSAALGRLGVVSPFFSGWGPHGLFLIVGVGLFLRPIRAA